jgi:hypothetical protein
VRDQIVWSLAQAPGLELLDLDINADGARFQSVVIDADPAAPFRAAYTIETDLAWHVRRLSVRELGGREHSLALRGNGNGGWTDAGGVSLPELAGCIDIDLTATPATNTLPIRRLDLHPGESATIAVAWVQFPDLTVRSSRQRYTCLAAYDTGAGRYRYEGLESGFTVELPVDANGVVRDYGDIWRRLR